MIFRKELLAASPYVPVPLGAGVFPPPIFLRAFRGGAKGSRSSSGVVFSLLDVRPDRDGFF